MAQHEGWYLKANVDISGLLQANKATESLLGNLKKVDAGIGTLHGNDALAKSIKSADIATATYIDRLKSEGKNYEANQEKVKLYTSQIERLKSKQSELSSELSTIAEKSGRNSDAYNVQKARINQTATAINKFKENLKDAQAEMDRLHPTGFDKWVSGAKRVNSATATMKSKIHSAWDDIKGGATAATAGIVAVGAAAYSGAKQAGIIQQRYREINNLAVLGGEKQKEVTKEITEMQRQGRDMSIKYGKSQEEIAEGYEDLVKRGYTTTQAVGALKTELQASVASGDKFSDVTTVSSQVLDAFGMRADSTSKMLANTKTVVNELAYSADATSTGFSDLGIAMSYVGTAAKANNISLAETASALGVLSNNGLESDKAGTALRGVINGLTNQINKIGSKDSVFTKLGITKSEMLDAHGNLKSLSEDMAILYKHIQEHSKGGSEQNGFFKSIFGTTSMNGAEILAKSSKEVDHLTKQTEEYGKTGTYVAKLAAKNMGTAQGSAASAKQAMNAFKMTLGNAVLPAINQASNSLAKFLLSKDGKQFQKDVGGAVSNVSNALVNFVKWGTNHKSELKAIGGAILAGYSISKGLQFISFLGEVKRNINELKGAKGILGGISEAANALSGSSSIKLPTSKKAIGPKAVIEEETSSGIKSGLAQTAVNKGASFLKAGTSKMFGGKLLSNGATKLGTKLGGSAGAGMTAAAGIGVAASSGIDIYKAITAKNPKSKFRNYGKAIGGAIGGGLGLYLGGPAGAAIGASLGRVAGKWAGDMTRRFSKTKFGKTVGHTFTQARWEIKQSLRPLSRDINGTVKSVNKQFGQMSRQIGRDWRSLNRNKDFIAFKNFLKSGLMATLRFAIKEGATLIKGAIKIVTGAVKILTSSIKGIVGIVHGTVKLIGDVVHGRWDKVWGDFKGIVKSAVGAVKGIMSGIKKIWDATIGAIADSAKNVWDFVTGKDWKTKKPENSTSVSSANSSVAHMQNGQGAKHHAAKSSSGYNVAASNAKVAHLSAHAKGTASLVGEAGPELAYKPWAGHVRLLGANGPQIAKVNPGEKILNARDTAKVMSGGLGQGKVLNGYANGNTKLGNTTKSVASDYKKISQNATKSLTKITKTNRTSWNKIQSNTSKSLTKITKINRRSWNSIETNAVKSVKSLAKNNQSTWSKVTRQTNKQTDKTRKNAISDYTDMRKGVHKQMDALHDGVIDLASTTSKGFGKELDHMKGYAHDAMGDTIDQVNKGITGIDKVLGQFGGNTSVIKPVKFATGTDSGGRLTENTLAMVNDAQSGPRQEALVSDKNELYFPRGNNVTMMIPKGWGVLNGTQTQQVSKSAGLRHFAKGSGVSHSHLKKIAEQAGANPSKAFAQMYSSNIHQSGPDLKKGTIGLAQNSSTHFGNPWSNAMWTVINDAIGGVSGKGGTREKFLKYAEETFSGVRYVMGAASKTASDCSGMVSQALAHFGLNAGRSTVDMQHSSALRYLGKDLSNTIPGDLVIFGHGTGAAGHVGIIKNPKTGTMFNETPPHARVTKISDDMGMGYGFYRVKGLHNASSSQKTVKADKNLQALAKRELGPSAIKWIKDKLGDEGSLGGNIGGEGVKRWAGTVKRILGMLHLSTSESMVNRVLRQINTESSGNPHARQPGADPDGDGSGPALGLMQTKRSTFEAYKRKGDSGGIFNGPSNIYAGLNYAKHKYGDSLSFLGNGHGYAKGGKPAVHTPFIAGERGPELITADGPVRVDTHEETKRKVSNLDRLAKPTKSTPRKSTSKPPVTININLNGPIGTSKRDAIDFANEVKQIVAEQILNLFGDEFGGDPSVY